MRWVLIGDGESPHLLKWARALAASPGLDLWAASSRGFSPEFQALVPAAQRLSLNTAPEHGGGNIALLKQLPKLGAWLAQVDADWLHAHYLTSHGTLAWMAQRGWHLRARIIGSAWGSDILVTPERSWAYRWLTRKVLRACALCTSDSRHMSARMRALGAAEVMTFPFGLEALPKTGARKLPWSFFANRGLEPIYRPALVVRAFAAVAEREPEARLVIANEGSLRVALEAEVATLGLSSRVSFVGRLDARSQASRYARARWYLSLPASDSVAVSVLEAMAHGCVPILSDLPANHELLEADATAEAGGSARPRGLILDETDLPALHAALLALAPHVDVVGAANRDWVSRHGLFAPAVQRFLARVQAFDPNHKKNPS